MLEISINNSGDLITSEDETIIQEGTNLNLYVKLKGTYRDPGNNNTVEAIIITVNFRNSLPKPIFELFIVVLIFCFFLITRTSKSEISSILPILGVFLAAAYRIIPSLSRIFTNLQRFQYNSQSIPKMSYDKQLFKFNDSINTKNLKKIHFEKNIELKILNY